MLLIPFFFSFSILESLYLIENLKHSEDFELYGFCLNFLLN